ncbi:MAG: hypothetical protein ACI4XG_05715, partial [Bradyrhizobium sp.]
LGLAGDLTTLSMMSLDKMVSGSGDEEMAAQPTSPSQKSGTSAKSGSKGTVGSSSGHATTPKSGGSEMAPGTKKY